ncbi:MAG: hypothetical protein CL606_04015 [Anaerolineaceae bacterium]|nr:hypothetical protein [Anaerolineaceae bacterium]|tara:strand:- start:46978 stop:48897 length:1920 start_codon:yes stop_codon:yes gene_type:complete
MSSVRRWYLFAVCAVSLQSVAWAAIVLLRGLLNPRLQADFELISVQIAVIIIGLPIFLWHWGRARDTFVHLTVDGGVDVGPAPLYLYLMMLGFIGPIIANAITFLVALCYTILGSSSKLLPNGTYASEAIISSVVALLVLSVLALYFRRQEREEIDLDSKESQGIVADIRRGYLFLLSITGLSLTIYSFIGLLNWMLLQLFVNQTFVALNSAVAIVGDQVARLLVGLILWQLSWGRAQALYHSGLRDEQESSVRKLYLYALVFVGSLAVVTTSATVLSGVLSVWLGLVNDGEIRIAVSSIIGFGIVWSYHALVLHHDAKQAPHTYKEAQIRRIYRYLLATIGFAVVLVGLGGVIDVIIRMIFGQELGSLLREQVANVSAALMAGLPIWLLSWRKIQEAYQADNDLAKLERTSAVRKVYIYFFLFVATMTVLASGVAIVSQLLNIFLGSASTDNLANLLAHAIAYSIIAVVVWVYHRALLHEDQINNIDDEKKVGMNGGRVVIFMPDSNDMSSRLNSTLNLKFPEITIVLTYRAEDLADLSAADVVITYSDDISAVANTKSRKLVIPTIPSHEWNFIGASSRSTQVHIKDCMTALRQIVSGDEIKPSRRLSGCVLAALIVVGVIILFSFVMPFIMFVTGM